MPNRLKSLILATFVLSLIPLSPNCVSADSPRTYAQTLKENPKLVAEKLFQQGLQQYRQGYFSKALKTYQEALAIYRQLNDKAGIGQSLNDIGMVYISLEKNDQALEVLQQALFIRQQLKDRKGEGETLDNIGTVYGAQHKYNKQQEFLQQALAIRREVKDRGGEGKTLRKIGLNYSDIKQDTEALKSLQQALTINREVNDRYQEGITLFSIGKVYLFDKKEYTTALEWYEKALVVNREVGNFYVQSISLETLGLIYQTQGKYDKPLEYYQQALKISRQLENSKQEARILTSMAVTYESQGDWARELEFSQQALTINKKLNDRPQQLVNLKLIILTHGVNAGLTLIKGDSLGVKQEASQIVPLAVQEALPLARELKDKVTEAHVLAVLSRAYFWLGDDSKAIESAQTAVAIAQKIPDLERENDALNALSNVYTKQGNFTKQIEIYKRQLQIAQQLHNTRNQAQVLFSLGNTYNSLGNYQKAVESFQQAFTKFEEIQPDKLDANLRALVVDLKLKTLYSLSFSYYGLGQIDKAIEVAQQGLREAQKLPYPEPKAEALINLGYFYTELQDFQKAIELTQQGLVIAKQIKNPQLETDALIQLSQAYTNQKNYQKATESAQQALTIGQQTQNPLIEAQALDTLKQIYDAQGNYQQALKFAQQRLIVYQQAHLPDFEHNGLIALGLIYIRLGDSQKAIEAANQALSLARQLRNPIREALALNVLSSGYNLRGEWEQAINAAQTSLEINRKSKDFIGEAYAASNLSTTYIALGETNKVIELAEPALAFAHKTKKHDLEVNLLVDLGDAYSKIGNYQKGKELVEQGLAMAQQLKNPALESKALDRLGNIYKSQNNYTKALVLAQKSLNIAKEIKSLPLQLSPTFTLGDIYSNLGDYAKSTEFYQQFQEIARKLNNRYSESIASLPLAIAYFYQGKPEKTIEFAQKGLTVAREIKRPELEAVTQFILSVGYGDSGNDKQAIENAQAFLTFARKVKNPIFEKTALNIFGSLHGKFGRKEQAIATYQQALAIKTESQVTGNDTYIYAGLARIYRDLNQPNIAIKYYKDSINEIEEVRRGIQGLPPELQKSFLDAIVDFDKVKVSDIYRQLAELLISQGRNKEALYVQELLRGQEIRDFISTGRGVPNKSQIPLTPTEKKVPALSQPLIALGNQLSECGSKNTQQCSSLRDKQTELIKQYYQQLQTLDKEIRENRQKDDIFFDPNKIGQIRAIVNAQPDSVMIYPLVTEKELIIQLYAKGDVVKTIPVPVGRKELGIAVKEFRSLMEKCENPGANCGAAEIPQVQAASQKLYNWLIKPIEGELRGSSVKNLVFSLDRVIRYIPVSALYDGKQYLIEKYTVYIAPTADLTDTKEKLPAGTQNTQVLAMGLSEPHSPFGALPNVPKELNAIVKKDASEKQGIYPGHKYLNSNFDFRTLRDNLKGHKILHLATHGVFDPESATKSYILLGTGKLTPDSIFALTGLSDIHLVVLSACQTALASPDKQDGTEINAFAYNFLNNKAKSVMASLWKVDDPSTAQLMEKFYGNLANSKTTITKAEALRLAQLSLLHGKQVSLNDIKRGGGIIPEQIPGKPGRQTTTPPNFSHPYYWAPFILMGNGL
ncbi:MAG: tetratricopeptide repeat protein [Rhizonema sp. NSF051]|nr:tetratricopeptide repeat protein [Rhizonema sp. NSF051]